MFLWLQLRSLIHSLLVCIGRHHLPALPITNCLSSLVLCMQVRSLIHSLLVRIGQHHPLGAASHMPSKTANNYMRVFCCFCGCRSAASSTACWCASGGTTHKH
jgi:hypothetical protein